MVTNVAGPVWDYPKAMGDSGKPDSLKTYLFGSDLGMFFDTYFKESIAVEEVILLRMFENTTLIPVASIQVYRL